MASVETLRSTIPGTVRSADPCTVVVFGAGGDLTKRKLFPALYNLRSSGILASDFAVIAFDHADRSAEAFRQTIGNELKEFGTQDIEQPLLEWLLPRIDYLPGDFLSADSYEKLGQMLASAEDKWKTRGNILFYLAVPPRFFGEIVARLGNAGLTKQNNDQWRRVIIEKPFGEDLDSALALNSQLQAVLDENQIYRIDHYLGKETVQNISVFRFANGIFESVWNNQWVDNVQITVAESVGVEGRGNYYDKYGALRDIVQNHMFQVMDLVTMEPPACFEANAVRDRKSELLRSVKIDDIPTNVVRGQYSAGTIGGNPLPAYRSEPSVNPESTTETYVALKLAIENDRWAGVPFYLRTGKALDSRVSEVAIQFKRSPWGCFGSDMVQHLSPNTLILQIQPEEGIKLRFGAKLPGPTVQIEMVKMDFRYCDYFAKQASSGYETLLYDCMIGDATLFTRADNLETCWKIVDPILDYWNSQRDANLHTYPAGSWGPTQADALLEKDGHSWRKINQR